MSAESYNKGSYNSANAVDSGDDLIPVTPSDASDLQYIARGLHIVTDGDLHVTTAAGTERSYPAGTFAVQTLINLKVTKVWATGTTATGIYYYV